MLLTNRLVIFQLFKYYWTAVCWGAIVWLWRSQGALPGLAAGQEAHESPTALLTDGHGVCELVQVWHNQLTAKPKREIEIKAIYRDRWGNAVICIFGLINTNMLEIIQRKMLRQLIYSTNVKEWSKILKAEPSKKASFAIIASGYKMCCST